MRSKYLMRLLAVGASAAAVLGGGSFALAADSTASRRDVQRLRHLRALSL